MSDSQPRLEAPPLACDCHIHIYDPAMPIAKTANGPGPAWASAAAYRTVQRRLGLQRAVVVQPTAYGTDNRCTMAAIAELGLDSTRGVAVVDTAVTKVDLERMHGAGIRGARFQMLPGGALPWDMVVPVASRIADLGWHIQLQMDGRLLFEREAMLVRLPCPVVIDHVGKFLEPVAVDHPGFECLMRLLDRGTFWLKLSAAYETSRTGPPLYEDVGVLAKHAVRLHSGRIVWASNWPHVGVGVRPDDAEQLDILMHWAPTESDRQKILTDNPASLYGF